MFKTIVSGDRINAERKHQDPFDFRPYARMLYSCNELPESKDQTHAFYRRWIIIPFERTFVKGENADPELRDKLTTPAELSGIFNKALEGLHRLWERERFTEPAQVREALQRYKRQNDTVAAFIEECCRLDGTASISKENFWQAYRTWCRDQGLDFESKNKMKPALERAIPNLDEYRPRGKPRRWIGVSVEGDLKEP
jgi:putative DNA primase/helicase